MQNIDKLKSDVHTEILLFQKLKFGLILENLLMNLPYYQIKEGKKSRCFSQ